MTARTSIQCKFSGVETLGEREFVGHGSVFDNLDLSGERVARGAFGASLAQHKRAGSMPAMLFQHDPSRVCGKWLDLTEDARGLAVRGVCAQTPLGTEIHELLKLGALTGLSIGFRTLDEDLDRDGNRVIKQAELWEISVVTFPANPAARVSSAKLAEAAGAIKNIRDFEHLTREVFGVSRNTSRKLAARCWPHFDEALHGEAAGQELASLSEQFEASTAAAILHACAARIRSL